MSRPRYPCRERHDRDTENGEEDVELAERQRTTMDPFLPVVGSGRPRPMRDPGLLFSRYHDAGSVLSGARSCS